MQDAILEQYTRRIVDQMEKSTLSSTLTDIFVTRTCTAFYVVLLLLAIGLITFKIWVFPKCISLISWECVANCRYRIQWGVCARCCV